MWSNFFLILLAVVLIWWLWRFLKANPKALTRANLSKSAFTLGVLALFLIVFIALCVMWLR